MSQGRRTGSRPPVCGIRNRPNPRRRPGCPGGFEAPWPGSSCPIPAARSGTPAWAARCGNGRTPEVLRASVPRDYYIIYMTKSHANKGPRRIPENRHLARNPRAAVKIFLRFSVEKTHKKIMLDTSRSFRAIMSLSACEVKRTAMQLAAT